MNSAATSEDVELLLAGLGVGSLTELKRLVDVGRATERREGRRADIAATVGRIPDPRERLVAALELGQEIGRAENGLFVCIALDADGALVNAAGVWPSEADAFLAAASIDLDDATAELKILPLFLDHVPERS